MLGLTPIYFESSVEGDGIQHHVALQVPGSSKHVVCKLKQHTLLINTKSACNISSAVLDDLRSRLHKRTLAAISPTHDLVFFLEDQFMANVVFECVLKIGFFHLQDGGEGGEKMESHVVLRGVVEADVSAEVGVHDTALFCGVVVA